MSFMEDIISSFGCKPTGPTYAWTDLKHHTDFFVKSVDSATANIEKAMLDIRVIDRLVGFHHDGLDAIDILSRSKHLWRWNALSWIEGEFVKVFREYSPKAVFKGSYTPTFESGYNDPRNYTKSALSHLDAALAHSRKVSDILAFFLCDQRSPFDKTKAINDRNVGCKWFSDGRRIVDENMAKIVNGLRAIAQCEEIV